MSYLNYEPARCSRTFDMTTARGRADLGLLIRLSRKPRYEAEILAELALPLEKQR